MIICGMGVVILKKMAPTISALCCLLGLAFLTPGARSYFVSVDADATECFFDKVTSGMKMSLIFEVVEGGFYDIDVEVRR